MKHFPVVRVSGTNYEVGFAIGKKMRQVIADELATHRSVFAKSMTEHLRESESYLQKAHVFFPQYIDELKGLADGAKVPFDELFLSNNREVADFEDTPAYANHCTIIGIPSDDGYILGHNEDWDPKALAQLYILDATVNGKRIFGLNYANTLVGVSCAINGFGLLEAVNDLSHADRLIGVPKNFIARAILDCQTLEEAEYVVKTIPRASGFNHVLAQGKRLWNIECSAQEYAIEKLGRQKYVHTNHYVTRLRRVDTEDDRETKLRYDKVKRLLPKLSGIDDVKRTLSDQREPSICRGNTIGSVIFDTPNKVAHIAYGQPTPTSYYSVSLPTV